MSNRYEEQVRVEWEKYNKENRMLPNILLLGNTGCGKSSLINTVFRSPIAPVNDVSRGTENFHTYEGKYYHLGVNLIDSRGYELEDGSRESCQNYLRSIEEVMKKNREKNPLEKIQIVWYCISITASVQEYDLTVLRKLKGEPDLRGRIAVILTKCDQCDEDGEEVKEFRRILAQEFGGYFPVFEVSTDPNLVLDLEQMVDWSANQIDSEDMKEAFVASQMVSLKKKRETAAAHITIFAVAAAGIGAIPIPFSDAALLTPLQLAMSTVIIRSYGMDSLVSISKAVVGNIVVSNLGKAIAGGLLKLIPGIGTIVGSIINATVAGLITTALGFAISEICYNCCKQIVKGEDVDFANLFDLDAIQEATTNFIESNKNSFTIPKLSAKDQERANEYKDTYWEEGKKFRAECQNAE